MVNCNVFGIVGIIADFAGVIGAITSIAIYLSQYREKKRLNQKIKICLVHKDDNRRVQSFIAVPGKMLREDLSRSEVLGWIGMLPMAESKKRQRFKIKSLSSQDFLVRMNEIKMGKGDQILEIFCEKDEIEQFAVEPQLPEQDEIQSVAYRSF